MSAAGDCASCGTALAGEYCAVCGERRLGANALSLRHFAAESFEALTDVEGKLPRSLRTLLVEPGRLTLEYCTGRRTGWVRPFQLFLLVAIAYFLFSGWQTFSTPLGTHLRAENFPHREVAERLMIEDLSGEHGEMAARAAVDALRLRTPVPESAAAAHADLLEYAARFDSHGALLARSLVFAMIPLLALGIWLLRLPRPEPGVKVLVYATHFTTAMLIILIGSGLIVQGAAGLHRLAGLTPAGFDEGIGTFGIFGLVGLYAGVSMQVAFGDSLRQALLRAFLLILWLYWMLLLYRVILFFAVRWTL